MSSLKSILIVDDEPDIVRSIQRILKLDGYVIQTAGTLAECLSKLTDASFFAILLDRKLPDGMSEEFLPQIKARAPGSAVVIITAYADLESSLRALREGAEDYLLKPVDPDVVRHRLKILWQAQDAERRARQSERLATIGQMVTVLSHESRNLLQRIRSNVELTRLDVVDKPDVLQQLDNIDTATAGLQKLLDEVRNYAAPIQLDRAPVCLASLWRRVWDETRQRHSARDARLIEVPPSNSAAHSTICVVDAFRIQQVLRNLFENSLAACVDPVEIRVSWEEVPHNGSRQLQVVVQDNGPGLSPEQQRSAFEPFFTTKATGTGLGLAISRRILESHGGDITLLDRGSGATFAFWLPCSPVIASVTP